MWKTALSLQSKQLVVQQQPEILTPEESLSYHLAYFILKIEKRNSFCFQSEKWNLNVSSPEYKLELFLNFYEEYGLMEWKKWKQSFVVFQISEIQLEVEFRNFMANVFSGVQLWKIK